MNFHRNTWKHRSPHAKFTQEEQAEIVRLYQSGLGYSPISKRLHASLRTIKNILIKHGITPKSACPKLVCTPEEIDKVISLFKEGKTTKEIGKMFNCSQGPINRICLQNGIKLRTYSQTAEVRRLNNGHVHLPPEIYNSWRRRSTIECHEWSITPFDIENTFVRQRGLCGYTGLPMKCSNHRDVWTAEVRCQPMAMSLDRRDSSKGYTIDNIILCCRFMNLAKNEWPEDMFRNALQRAAVSVLAAGSLEDREKTEDSLTS